MIPSHATITLIDSDTSVRRALSRIFAAAGFATEAFASAEEFLGTPRDRNGTCVVADTRLPGIGGLELMRRAGLEHPGIPFILLTTEDDDAMRLKARAAGAAALFRKPIDPEALLDSVRWALPSPLSAVPA